MEQFNGAVTADDKQQRNVVESAAQFHKSLENQVRQWTDDSQTGFFAVAFLDVVRFRSINDSFGYTAGNRLLNEIAGKTRQALDCNDILAHFGADRFAVLLRSCQNLKHAEQRMQRILLNVEREYSIGEGRIALSARIGLACPHKLHSSADAILRDADAAHQQARLRRESIIVNRQPLSSTSLTQASLEFDLAEALNNDELFFEFQPIFDPSNGRVRLLEALLRWHHPRLGVISPTAFISLAEDSGLVLDLDIQGLARLGRQLDAWRAEFPDMREVPVSINISGRHFPNFTMEKQFHRLLRQPALRRSQIIFEITESVFVEGDRKTIEALQRLRNAGVKIWLDDFGEGHSSFRYLTNFPIDGIKIASCFTRHCANQPKSRVVLTALQALARGLGVEAVAEGVETREQFETLENMGFNALQGYYLARPMGAKAIPPLLRDPAAPKAAMLRSA